MAHVARLTTYPVKGLDSMAPESADILPGGTLAHDREFALFGPDGDTFNGKQSARFSELTTTYDRREKELVVETDGGRREQFALGSPSGRERAADWFGDFFDADLTMERDAELGYVDRRNMGPSVISTATLETVAAWFGDVTVDGARRRLRANVEIGGVPAFWEDRFVGEAAPAFVADGIRFEGETPCARCVVPERDPETGEPTPKFRERFIERRRETFPEWADENAFDHFYTLMLISRIPEADRERTISVGDDVAVVDD